ncbi:TraB/GumN family protein [Chitinophaga sp.]|uniref:TraB/GumN family protein n=1 Tax=Chitinophaga sp. TaxID=1869181 RepID=UPI002F934EC3
MKIIPAIALLLTSLFTGHAKAQQPASEKSLLWEVSGNGLDKPSYIYGTIHLICESDFRITDKVKKAFDKSSQLVLEADIFSPEIKNEVQQEMMSDVPLSKKLAASDYAAIDSILKLKCGMPLKVLDNYKLSMVMSLVAIKLFPCTAPQSYEAAFDKMAKEKNMHKAALEEVIAQLKLLNKAYTDSQIIAQVKSFDSAQAGTNTMVALYKAEDINGLFKYMTTPDLMDENTIKWMLVERNNDWAEKMPAMMKKESNFFAVGAAHLPGPIGILALLKAKGYTVKPIMN